MSADELPAEVRRFIAAHIVTVEQLEVPILLSASPEQFWSPEQVFQKIQSSLASVKQRLEDLRLQGFLQLGTNVAPTYRFDPSSSELLAGVSALKEAYQLRRVKVIEVIYSTPKDQIRDFAEAFRFRKET